MEEKHKSDNSVSAAIGETPIWLFFGKLPVRVKPLTLMQIWEIGELVTNCKQLDAEGHFNAIEKMLEAHSDLRNLQEVVVKAVFRSSVARFLFGWYIRRKTTMELYRKVITFCATSFSAPFFFSKFDFPKRSKTDNDEYSRSTSPWGFIGGIMKYFRMSYDEVVFKRSYLNLLLLNAAIPSIKPYNEDNENSDALDYSTPRKTKTRDYSLNDNGNSFLTSLM